MIEIYIDPVIAELRAIYSTALEENNSTLVIRELLTIHTDAIYKAFLHGNSAVAFHLGSWCPAVVGKNSSQIMAFDLNLIHVQESVAREYGFSNWESVVNLNNQRHNPEFELAVEKVISGDIDALQNQLEMNPELALQKSGYGHSATLLHYLGANGIESQRQITPMNCGQIAQCLIEYGAEVNAHANMYGGGSTTLELVLSSAHPKKAGVVESLANVLKAAGAH